MTTKAYIGVGGVARQIKKIYTGVGGVAKQVKRGYVGVNGVARLFYVSEKQLVNVTTSNLRVPRKGLAASSNANYAMFAGGMSWEPVAGVPEFQPTNAVQAYDKNLTTPGSESLTGDRADLAGASIPSYSFFAGGWNGRSTVSQTDAFNTNLLTEYVDRLFQPAQALSGGNVGSAGVVFFGGTYDGISASTKVTAYDFNLNRNLIQASPVSRWSLASASIGNYVFFAGGLQKIDSPVPDVDVYNLNYVRQSIQRLSQSRCELSGARCGKYVIFAGGSTGIDDSPFFDTCDVYDENLVKTSTPIKLRFARTLLASATLNNQAFFAGGYDDETDPFGNKIVEYFDENITKQYKANLTYMAGQLAGTSIDDVVIFAGGATRPTDPESITSETSGFMFQ